MCTRLLNKTWIHYRRFASIFIDRQKPYQLNMILRRQTPKNISDVDVGISSKGAVIATPTSKTSFTKQSYIRFSTEEEANDMANKLHAGNICLKCGHPRNCTKSMFRKWE